MNTRILDQRTINYEWGEEIWDKSYFDVLDLDTCICECNELISIFVKLIQIRDKPQEPIKRYNQNSYFVDHYSIFKKIRLLKKSKFKNR